MTRIPLAALLLLALCAPRAHAVPQDDRRLALEAAQARAKELMGELEDRMFRMSEELREAQPDDAARLVLALQRAREELIVEEMAAIEQHLAAGDLEAAAERQDAVLRRLDSLRGMLLSTDLDFLVRLERLRRLDELLARLEELSRESQALAATLEDLATPAQDAAAEAARQRKQKGAQLAAEDVAGAARRMEADVEELAGADSEAARAMQQAGEELASTQRSLEQENAGAAKQSSARAEEARKEVEEQLARAREDLIWELVPHLRRQVIEALEGVRDELAEELAAASPAPEREERLRRVRGMVGDVRALVLETDFSVQLGPFLAWFAASLDPPAAWPRLAEVLDEALGLLVEEEDRWRASRGDESRRRMIKLVAELKGCRLVQRVLREDAARLGAEPGAAPGDGDGARAAALADLAGWETALADGMRTLEERYYAELAAGRK